MARNTQNSGAAQSLQRISSREVVRGGGRGGNAFSRNLMNLMTLRPPFLLTAHSSKKIFFSLLSCSSQKLSIKNTKKNLMSYLAINIINTVINELYCTASVWVEGSVANYSKSDYATWWQAGSLYKSQRREKRSCKSLIYLCFYTCPEQYQSSLHTAF